MRTFWTLLVATALCIGAQAQTLLYSTSFENPPFVAGQSAVGVDGWAAGSGGGASQTVSDAVACSGSQSLRWDNSGTLNSFYSIRRVLGWNPTSASNSRLIVRVSLYISSSTQANRLYGVYLTGTETGTLSGTVLGVTIAGDGKIRVGTSWGATYSSTTWLAQAPAGTYTDRCLRIEIDYDSEPGRANIRVSGFADGAEYTATLSQPALPVNINLGTDYVTTTERAGVGYFDDLEILEAPGTPFEGWDEIANGGGDAGDQIETAQRTSSNPIPRIRGTIGAANDVDIYALYIEDPQNFSASTIGGTTLDTALWLFDADGKGVLHNEDNPDATTGTQSRIDNRGGQITQPGIYYLAISLFGRRAAGCDEGLIWSSASTFWRQIVAPNGNEPNSRLGGWSGSTSATGRYIITLTGVRGEPAGTDPADCPPPTPWDEQFYGGGDAGDLPSNAQIVALSGQTPCQSPVTRIRGDNAANDVDMYVIYIQDPANFVASTVGTPTAWDTQLWLFRCDGRGVVFNDDNPDGTGTLSRIDNRTNCITEPGVYLLAISRYNRDAVDAGGQLLWNNSPFTTVRCPDGPGAANSVAGWTGTTSAGGRYIITLQGAFFVTEQGCAGTCPGQCPGDANNDGRVNNADLLVVLFNFGQSGSGVPGDVNGDNVVNNADLLVVLFNFGCGS